MEIYLRGLLTGVFFGLWAGMAIFWQPDPGVVQFSLVTKATTLAAVLLVGLMQYRWAKKNVLPKGAA